MTLPPFGRIPPVPWLNGAPEFIRPEFSPINLCLYVILIAFDILQSDIIETLRKMIYK
jgi:hypothetical protein